MTSDDSTSELSVVFSANSPLGEGNRVGVSVLEEGEMSMALALLLLGSVEELFGNTSGEGAKSVKFVTLLVFVMFSNRKLGLLLGTPAGSEGLGLGLGYNSKTFALGEKDEDALPLKFCKGKGEGENTVELDMMAMYSVLCILCMTK